MKKEYKDILVIKLSAFGDFLFALGAMKDVRDRYPDAKVTLLTTAAFEKMAKETGYFDRVIIDKRIRFTHLNYKKLKDIIKAFINFKHKLRGFDLVVDFQVNDRTALYYWLLFPFKKPDWCGNVFTCKYRINKKYRNLKRRVFNATERLDDEMKMLGVLNPSLPDISWIKTDIKKLKLPKKYVVLIAGCAPTRPLKRWSATSYGRLGNMLVEKGYTPVLIGTDADKEANKGIKEICPKAIDLTNKTAMFDLAEIGRNAKFSVANDTGPAIMVSLAGSPTVILYSKDSSPRQSLPPAEKIDYIKVENLNNLKPQKVIDKLEKIGYLK